MIVDSAGNEFLVFDSHTHLGTRPVRAVTGGSTFSGDEMVARMDASGVDCAVAFPMQNQHTDYRTENLRVLEFQRAYPHRLFAFARIQPMFVDRISDDIDEYASLGFRGLKIHPFMDFGGIAVNREDFMYPVMEAAEAHGLVVVIHSGESWNASPALIGDLADHFPKVPVVIAHSGLFEGHQDAIVVARRTPNVLVDVAEVSPPGVVANVVHGIGANRVLFGSDHPFIPFGAEIRKVVQYAGIGSSEARQVLGLNVADVLNVSLSAQTPPVPIASL